LRELLANEGEKSEQAFLAIAQGNAPKGDNREGPGYKDIKPLFIKGECAEP
jgi:hypothetical protein